MYAEDFGFSGPMASRCLEQEIWREEAAMARPEGWMAACAMSADRKVCQSFLGQRIRSPQAPTPDIVDAIRQAVGNLFWCAEKDQEAWIGRTGSEPVPTFGPDHELLPEDPPSGQDKMLDLFRSGVNELEPVLAPILAAETYGEIKRIAGLDPRAFSFGDALWVRTLYEFAAAYHHTVLNRDHIVQALVPLYRGRIYSFLSRHVNSSADEMEAATEALCVEFETQKSYLVEKWNANVEVKS
jgi:glucosylglycerate synthase